MILGPCMIEDTTNPAWFGEIPSHTVSMRCMRSCMRLHYCYSLSTLVSERTGMLVHLRTVPGLLLVQRSGCKPHDLGCAPCQWSGADFIVPLEMCMTLPRVRACATYHACTLTVPKTAVPVTTLTCLFAVSDGVDPVLMAPSSACPVPPSTPLNIRSVLTACYH
jgi:hypothetical protein